MSAVNTRLSHKLTPFPATVAGTHVSGTAVGLRVGVAKEAEVVAVRILDCTGSGTISDTVAALDWVAGAGLGQEVPSQQLGS